ncbi:MAG: hypothetical protein EOO45_04080 [Flavobacterium sp.]|nr:MAG: hypothetical protein EOO45_04080 [Flavobacterium sp.]
MLYLFIFAVLMNIFTYMYFTNKAKFQDTRFDKVQKESKMVSDSLRIMKEKMADANYFGLENNDNAIEYFAGQDIGALAIKIRDGVYAKNNNPKGNPLVQYPPMNDRPFIVNKLKVLNNRWIIADFSNGTAWGEVLIKYFIEQDGSVTYETIQTLLYSQTAN